MLINQFQKKSVDGRKVVYFQNRPARLAGIYPDIQTLDGAGGDTSTAANVDFQAQMERLAERTNNFFRFWVIFYSNFVNPGTLTSPNFPGYPDCKEKDPSLSFTSEKVSWRERYSPFKYQNKKWDLTAYNDDYFLRLRKMIETAADYGIVVQLTLFDRCGTDALHDCTRWPYSPWNAYGANPNNVNGLLKDPVRGVNLFYNRAIKGVSPGPPAKSTTLGDIQDAYVTKVVSETVEYPNVMYEIMNEPIHNPAGATNLELTQESKVRAAWAAEIVGVIWDQTRGNRFIFYNDHTFPGQAEAARGQDIINWKNAGYKNYAKLDGVIFHGDIKAFNPGKLAASIRQDKIIQVSTDTHTDEGQDYNALAAKNAFDNSMIFQAEALSLGAASGIGSVSPPPTLFKLPPLVGKWVKLVGQPGPTNLPHVMHIQNANGTYADLNQDTDQILSYGHVVRLDTKTISFLNQGQHIGTFAYAFMNNGTDLIQFTANNVTQVYRRVDVNDPVWRFLGKWERVSVIPADSQILPFFACFYVDRTLVARLVSDPSSATRFTLTNISTQTITLRNNVSSGENVWKYTFSGDGKKLTLDKRNPADPTKPSNPALIEVLQLRA